ncbi:MAG TPA: peptidoglycan recognition family protein [Verrucomicrobiota bacterium]|nr:peptidoglycan recognition family protein [Verrucomicrobiota bacterium]HNU51312.1 peptidoglycan recognition family protein [Verrucomicrobiota bacterium]
MRLMTWLGLGWRAAGAGGAVGWRRVLGWMALAAALGALGTGCRTMPRPGTPAPRAGDEIVVGGRWVHTGTRVVLWSDPGGYDAYRVERRFSPIEAADWEASHAAVKDLDTPNRYGLRRERLTPEQVEQVRGGGWDYALLTNVVDQFVVHYDACGTSRQCFKVLHDLRGLSVHFLLDADGTIYQTLDLKERAWHATTSNTRSVGIEMAHIGAVRLGARERVDAWYPADETGGPRLTVPARFGDPGFRVPGFVGRPARPEAVRGVVQGTELIQYDFTPEQYAALARLTATLCRVFPRIRCDYPRDAEGRLVTHVLEAAALERFEGVLGHFHIQTNKVDPGPAFQWDAVLGQARRHLRRKRAGPSGLWRRAAGW